SSRRRPISSSTRTWLASSMDPPPEHTSKREERYAAAVGSVHLFQLLPSGTVHTGGPSRKRVSGETPLIEAAERAFGVDDPERRELPSICPHEVRKIPVSRDETRPKLTPGSGSRAVRRRICIAM